MSDPSPTEAILKQIEAARREWIEVEPGKRLLVHRPSEWGFLTLQRSLAFRELGFICGTVKDWTGMTLGDVLGPDGGTAPLPFGDDLIEPLLSEHVSWVTKIIEHATLAVDRAKQAREAARKNSTPS